MCGDRLADLASNPVAATADAIDSSVHQRPARNAGSSNGAERSPIPRSVACFLIVALQSTARERHVEAARRKRFARFGRPTRPVDRLHFLNCPSGRPRPAGDRRRGRVRSGRVTLLSCRHRHGAPTPARNLAQRLLVESLLISRWQPDFSVDKKWPTSFA